MMENIRETVLSFLGADADLGVVDSCINISNDAVKSRFKRYGGEGEVPESLHFVIIELAIARYNRIGSEGMSVDSIEGQSTTYINNLLDHYDKDIRLAVDSADTGLVGGRVRFY